MYVLTRGAARFGLLWLSLWLSFSTAGQAQGNDPNQGRPTVGVVYMHTNHLGSTTFTTDEEGQLKARFAYEPFGSLHRDACEGPDDIRPKFTGKELDADTELYYFEARYYDAQSGRFVSSDNQAGAPINHPMAFHRYAYSANNPINVTDPSGHSAKINNLPDDSKAYLNASHGTPSNLKEQHLPASDLMVGSQPEPVEETYTAYVPFVQVQQEAVNEVAATPEAAEEDVVVTETVQKTGISVGEDMDSMWAEIRAYLESLGVGVEVSFGAGFFKDLLGLPTSSFLNSADVQGWVNLFGTGYSNYVGLGGGVSVAVKFNVLTYDFQFEVAVQAGIGGGNRFHNWHARAVAVGLEGKIYANREKGLHGELSIFSELSFGPNEFINFKVEKTLLEHDFSYTEKRAMGMPDAWARSSYSFNDYLNVLLWYRVDVSMNGGPGFNCVTIDRNHLVNTAPGFAMSQWYKSPEEAQIFLEIYTIHPTQGVSRIAPEPFNPEN
jgi:RHS repeat-associated protein